MHNQLPVLVLKSMTESCSKARPKFGLGVLAHDRRPDFHDQLSVEPLKRTQKLLWKRFLSCVAATVSRKLLKASSHIDDRTRHDSMGHHPFFHLPYNQMDQFTHMQHNQVWSSRQKAAARNIALEAIFVVCRSDSIKKTAKENSFHRNFP